MKILRVAFIFGFILGCAEHSVKKEVMLYTFAYSPYLDSPTKGMLVELVHEAYKTQGVSVKFDVDTLENAYEKSKNNNGIMLGSREYQFIKNQKSIHEELYIVATFLVSIGGREINDKMGAFSSDEIEYAKNKHLIPIRYTTPKDGLLLLASGAVGSIICTDISCDQIKFSNPNIKFNVEPAYQFPVDLVYFGESAPAEVTADIATLKKGLYAIIENGKYLEIQHKYKIENPLFRLPLDGLLHIKVEK